MGVVRRTRNKAGEAIGLTVKRKVPSLCLGTPLEPLVRDIVMDVEEMEGITDSSARGPKDEAEAAIGRVC